MWMGRNYFIEIFYLYLLVHLLRSCGRLVSQIHPMAKVSRYTSFNELKSVSNAAKSRDTVAFEKYSQFISVLQNSRIVNSNTFQNSEQKKSGDGR